MLNFLGLAALITNIVVLLLVISTVLHALNTVHWRDHLSLQVEYPLKFAKSDLCGLLKALPNTSDVEEIAREVKKRILCQNSALKIRNVRVFDKESPMTGVKIVIIVQVTVKGISPLRRKQDWINMYLYDNRA